MFLLKSGDVGGTYEGLGSEFDRVERRVGVRVLDEHLAAFRRRWLGVSLHHVTMVTLLCEAKTRPTGSREAGVNITTTCSN